MALTRPTLAQLTTGIARVSDPITTLHAGFNSANVDIGFLMNRANGLVSNVALYWNETGNTFVTAFTSNTGETNSNISVTSYATLTTGNLAVNGGLSATGNITANTVGTHYGNVNSSGNITTSGNVYATSFFYANGTQFVGGGGGGITYTANTAPPVSGNVSGSQWYNTATDTLYEYIYDGTNYYWVDVGSVTYLSNVTGTSSSGTSAGYTNTYILTGTTTNNTQTEIFINGVANSRVRVGANTAVYYTADVTCRRTDSMVDFASFFLKSMAANVSGTTSDVGSVYEVVVARTDASFLFDAKANTSTGTVNFFVTGANNKTVSWKAVVSTVEI